MIPPSHLLVTKRHQKRLRICVGEESPRSARNCPKCTAIIAKLGKRNLAQIVTKKKMKK